MLPTPPLMPLLAADHPLTACGAGRRDADASRRAVGYTSSVLAATAGSAIVVSTNRACVSTAFKEVVHALLFPSILFDGTAAAARIDVENGAVAGVGAV